MNIFDDNFTKIMLNLHFIPGDPIAAKDLRIDGAYSKYVTTPNCKNVRTLLKMALATTSPYLIGIASHAFADTWAHQNFTGLNERYNAIDSSLMSAIIPNIGHADALSSPDEIDEVWYDLRLKNPKIINKTRFKQAAKALLKEFSEHNNKAYEPDYISEIFDVVKHRKSKLFKYREYDLRIKFYKKMHYHPQYREDAWFLDSVKRFNRSMKWKKDPSHSDWYLFQESLKVFLEASDKLNSSI